MRAFIYINAMFTPLMGLVLAAGVIGCAAAFLRAWANPSDPRTMAEAFLQSGRIFLLLAMMGGFGLVASWAVSSFAASGSSGSLSGIVSALSSAAKGA